MNDKCNHIGLYDGCIECATVDLQLRIKQLEADLKQKDEVLAYVFAVAESLRTEGAYSYTFARMADKAREALS